MFKAIEWYGTRLHHRGNYRVVNALRRLTNADIDAELIVRRDGLTWSLNPSDFVHQDVFWHGVKDKWDVWHLRRMLPPTSLIVDIGSNFGYYAVYLAHHLGPQARAIAFEPMPRNFGRLVHNIGLNGLNDRVKPLRVGLSRVPGWAQMGMREGNSGSAQIQGEAGTGIAIELDALDRIWDQVAGHDARCDFVKLDVEGHEVAALSGARNVIERHRPVILLEVDPPRLAECGSSPRELQASLDDFGYRYFVADRKRLTRTTIADSPELVNVFCLHPARSAAEIAAWGRDR